MDFDEFRICPYYPQLRVSKDGRVQTGFLRGRPNTKRIFRWLDLKVHYTCGKYPRISTVSQEQGKEPHIKRHKQLQLKLHRLIALTWLEPPADLRLEVCHKDDDPMNYHADNLYWGTHFENMSDAVRNGRIPRREALEMQAHYRAAICDQISSSPRREAQSVGSGVRREHGLDFDRSSQITRKCLAN